MKNVEMTMDDDKVLHIKIDTKKTFGPSKTGKTIIVASSGGNKLVPDEDNLWLGLNAYRK